MKIAFVADEITTFKKNHDSTWALMRAGFEIGHEIFYAHISDLAFAGEPLAKLVSLDEMFFFHQEKSLAPLLEFPSIPKSELLSLENFDCVFMRADPPVDKQYLHACQILSLCQNPRVINSPRALLEHNEKLSILQFPDLILPTIVSMNLSQIEGFVRQHQVVVVKPLDLMGGQGIYILDNFDKKFFQDLREPVMIQKFLPEVKINGDKRLIVVNGKLIGALRRIPSEKDFRANIAAGGSYVAYTPNARDQEICARISNFLIDNKIYFAGIDVIGDYLTEINITSPTCLHEINEVNNLKAWDRLEFKVLENLK
jgi:glutathione synthase